MPFKYLDLKPVKGQPADKGNRFFKNAIGYNSAYVISGISRMKTKYNIFEPLSPVLEMNHV